MSKVVHAGSSRGRLPCTFSWRHLVSSEPAFSTHILSPSPPASTSPHPRRPGGVASSTGYQLLPKPLLGFSQPCSLPAFPVIACHPLHIDTHTPPHSCLSRNVPAFSSLRASLPLCSDLNCSPSISTPDLPARPNCSNQPLSIGPQTPAGIQAGSKVPRMLCITLFTTLLSARPPGSYL